MRGITLVAPLVFGEHRDAASVRRFESYYRNTPPLGPLTLAAGLRRRGIGVSLLDTSRAYADHILGGSPAADFPAAVADQLASSPSEVFGFSTMCDSYPGTIAMARRLRALRPDAFILFGGPQATATAEETVGAFPFVDAVFRGEAEPAFDFLPSLLSHPEKVPGLVFRRSPGELGFGPSPGCAEVDELPDPAYDLWLEGPLGQVPIEAGRGCPFACRFCSTSSFFQRRFRLRSAERLVAQARRMVVLSKARSVVLLHDHMAVDEARLAELADRWQSDPVLAKVPWLCSARLDSLTDGVVATLERGGCQRVFVGIETGSQRMQRVVGKRLNLAESERALDALGRARIGCTVSFILGYPEETGEDLAATLDCYARTLARPNCRPQVALLSPLGGSGYAEEFRDRLQWDGRASPLLGQLDGLGAEEEALVRSWPGLFSAHHALPLEHLRRERVLATVLFLRYGANRFRFLLLALSRTTGGLPGLLDRWLDGRWKDDRYLTHRFYGTPAFVQEFLSFAGGLCASGARGNSAPALRMLEACYRRAEVLHMSGRRAAGDLSPPAPGETLQTSSVVLPVDYSLAEVLRAVVGQGLFDDIVPRQSVVVVNRGDEQGPRFHEPNAFQRALLLAFLTPSTLAAQGDRLAERLAPMLPADIPLEAAIHHAVSQLAEGGLLVRV
jgi:hypothetical protein